MTHVLKVLIVDPNKAFAVSLANTLSEKYDVHIGHSGIDACSLVENLLPDILIIALHLPGKDGFSVLRSCKHIPKIIVALTSFVNKAIISKAEELGVTNLVMIPCTAKHVAAIVSAPPPVGADEGANR